MWADFIFGQDTLAAVGGTIIHTMNAAFLALRPFTIVRSRFTLMLRSDQSAVVENQGAAFALAVVTEQALGIGVTAVPTPVTDLGSDQFFLHQIMWAHQNDVAQQSNPAAIYEVDSKAMRKVGENDELYSTGEFTNTAQGCVLHSAGRMLIKLH